MYLIIFNICSLPGLRVCGGGAKLHRGQDSAQLSQRGHHPAAACGWVGSWWESKRFLCFLHLWAIFCVLVPAAPLLTWCASLWLRQTLRLYSEKESHASGGTEEGHFWVWCVWQGCSVCVHLSVLYKILLWYIAPYFHFFILRCLFSQKMFSSNACVTLTHARFGWVQVGASGLCMANQEPSPVSTSIRWQPRTSWFSRLTAWSPGTDTGKWLHLRPSLWPWGPP